MSRTEAHSGDVSGPTVDHTFGPGDWGLDKPSIGDRASDARVVVLEATGERAADRVLWEEPNGDVVTVHTFPKNDCEPGDPVVTVVYASTVDAKFPAGWSTADVLLSWADGKLTTGENEGGRDCRTYDLPESRLWALSGRPQ